MCFNSQFVTVGFYSILLTSVLTGNTQTSKNLEF